RHPQNGGKGVEKETAQAWIASGLIVLRSSMYKKQEIQVIKLGKDIQEMDKEPLEMGLTDYEYAFYTAISNNESAREVMGKDQLRELAVVLYERIKENASIDWTIKESVRAKLKVVVKRTLRQFGYPPDMQKLATETVLKQAEMIAGDFY
ncbi:MAG: DUF3387 domain-containing protein, partial [Bacteroidetes bacterium]|nr:DUF3387 domain-containing protein [Bacteroidota bacterium]